MFSQTPEEHLVRLQAVFDKLKAAGLKLKPSKCELFKKQINYLGHVVGQEGVSTDPDKIKAVTEWPRPTTVTEVRSFLGFVSYYRRFIPNFSKVAKPLNTLLQNLEGTSNQKKKFKVNWGPEQQEVFETLQRLCTEAPILAYADFKTPFILHTDTSSDGLGAVLYQYQNNQRRIIAYALRSLIKYTLMLDNQCQVAALDLPCSMAWSKVPCCKSICYTMCQQSVLTCWLILCKLNMKGPVCHTRV